MTTESKARRILEEYGFAVKALEAEQACLESLISQLNTSKTVVNGSGMDSSTMVDKVERIVMELQEHEEVVVNLAKDCIDTLHDAKRLIGSLGGIGIRERWKAILKLRYLQQHSWRHVAARMGMDQRNVRASHDAALKYLDAALRLHGSRQFME